MTLEQFERWKLLADGLVDSASVDPPIRDEVREHVQNLIGILVWDGYKDNPELVTDWDSGPRYVCDAVSSYVYEERLETEEVENPDGSLTESEYTPVGAAVVACIRAALDLASAPSAGTLGWFTVGDLRRVLGSPLPAWASDFFEQRITPDVPDSDGVWL